MADHGTLPRTLQTDHPPLGSPFGTGRTAPSDAHTPAHRWSPSGSGDGPEKLASAEPLPPDTPSRTPGPVTRGSQPPNPPTFTPLLGCDWDYYRASFPGLDDGRIAPALAIALGGTVAPGKGLYGYGRGYVVEVNGEAAALVAERPGDAMVQASGAWSREVAPVLRRLWPAHRVARVDSAFDFAADFEMIDRMAVAFSEQRGISNSFWSESNGGRTRYLGSRTSEFQLRIYEKSKKWMKDNPDRIDEIPQGIIRAELEYKPSKSDTKMSAASVSPDDVWGRSKWAATFASEYLAFEPTRTTVKFHRSTDWLRTIHWLGKQYGPAVRARIDHEGREAVLADVLAALGLVEA